MQETADNKLIALRRIKLPEDVIHEICGFIFYDSEVSLWRETKRQLMTRFKTTLMSGHDLQHWWFCMIDQGNEENPQFQCVFCSECGNYIASNNDAETIAQKAVCECL